MRPVGQGATANLKPQGAQVVDADKSVVSLARGLALLRAFHSSPTPLSNSELAARSGLSKATVARLTYTLVVTGFLDQSPRERGYALGPKVGQLGEAFLRSVPVRAVAAGPMQRFADEHTTSVALAVAEGAGMACIASATGRNAGAPQLRLGTVVPMLSTAVGRAYLASQVPDSCDMADELRPAIAELESRGWTAVHEEWRGGAKGVALGVPVRLDAGRTIVGLTCLVPRGSGSTASTHSQLGSAILALSAAIADAMEASHQTFWSE